MAEAILVGEKNKTGEDQFSRTAHDGLNTARKQANILRLIKTI
jgi:hypothetical protein